MPMTRNEAVELYEELMERFNALKSEISSRSRHHFENWKAGGFALDNTFFSNYSNLEDVIDTVFDEADEDDEDEDEWEDDNDFEDEDEEDDEEEIDEE